jgi:nucleoside-diphosphate-sugar epimerase
MPWRFLITGATGFIGSHVVEACKSRGHSVSTVARTSSDTTLLENLGVTIHRGELADAAVVSRALADADVVVHCAAKVGDRGGAEVYRPTNVDALRVVLDACKGRALHRFVHMSSLGVYEPRHHYGTDETEPLPTQHFDGYTQSKVEAEQLALRYGQEHAIPLVVLRPGFVYGPRDRAVIPAILERMKHGRVHFLGGDQRVLNTIYVGNLVDAVFLAVDNPQAVGQIYNLTDGEAVTRERFFGAIADGLGVPRSRQLLPRWVAGILVRILRRQIRRAGPNGNPWLTQARFKFLLLNLDFSIDKAKRELGYRPRVSFDEGMRETMAWYRQKT